MTDQRAVLHVHDLTVRGADGMLLFDQVSLTARRGELTAVTGPSGCGKTTLLRACAGALPATFRHVGGNVTVLRHDVLALSADQLRALRVESVAYVGQDPATRLNPRMRISRILRETATDPAGIEPLLRLLQLPTDGHLLRRRPGQISGGEARRIALARALARRPSLLLLDEPTASLDPTLRADLATLLHRLARESGIAVVVACHDPNLADVADQRLDLQPITDAIPVRAHDAPESPASGPARLTVTDLHAVAGTTPVLHGTDLTLPTGSMTGLVGASGSGKTTLARSIIGLHPPTHGTITLDDVPLQPRTTRRSRTERRCIQLVPQDPLGSLNPSRTVRQTLARPLRLHRIRDLTVSDLLAMVQLPPDLASRYPGELSGGQRQRVALARALATSPDVLVCDEITSALDSATANGLLSLLDRLRSEQQLTVLLVTHDHDLATRYCHTVHRLTAGALEPLAAGSPS